MDVDTVKGLMKTYLYDWATPEQKVAAARHAVRTIEAAIQDYATNPDRLAQLQQDQEQALLVLDLYRDMAIRQRYKVREE